MEKHPLDDTDLNVPLKRHRQEEALPPGQQLELAPKQPPEDKLHNDGVFCDDCRAVNWSSLPTLAANGYLESQSLDLRPLNAKVDELRNSSCRICAFLSTMKAPFLDRDQSVLNALPLSRHFGYDGSEISRNLHYIQHTGTSATRCTVLGVTRKYSVKDFYCLPSLAVIRRDDLESRRILPSSVDYNKFKGLVRICEENHKTCCTIGSSPNVLGLEVIDTRTQAVVKAPDQCRYLALSYVWGKQADDSSVHNINDSPLVIQDAISVTKAMGYNYLWIDRYCISDSKDKHKMISQMDQIYANASITIIAAADGDTDMGLCGVSMPRKPQQRIDIQDVSLLELPLGHEDLTSSKWATRGWTYQEGYLSTRRLIFTNTQILFLCNGMYAAESLQRLLSAPCYAEDMKNFHHLIPQSKISRRFSIQAFRRKAEEYSKRELTRSDDSLNAFLGVLSYYAKGTAAFTSPVLRLPWGLVANKHAEKNSFSLHFFWNHANPATRRGDFPSWSWTGWGGHVKFCGPEIVLQPKEEVEEGPFSHLDWDISVRYEDCRLVRMYDLAWEEFEARKDKHRLYQPGPKKLQVSCLAIPVSFREVDMTGDQKHHRTDVSIHDTGDIIPIGCNLSDGTVAILQVWKGIYVGIDQQAHLKLDQRVEKQDCIMGLITAKRIQEYDRTFFSCLLVRKVVDDLYERVGWLELNKVDLNNYGPPPKDSPYELASQMIFLDSDSGILNKFTISERQRKYPFRDTAEMRTICLV